MEASDKRRRADGLPPLGDVERRRRSLARPVRGKPVDGVGWQDRKLASPQRRDGRIDLATHPGRRPSTTRSRPARSGVTTMST